MRIKRFRRPSHWTLSQTLAHYSIPEPNSGCHLWLGATLRRGYGNLYWDGKPGQAHRLAWALKNGPIPAGMVVCHKCDNPPCCNPDHLFLGTMADNVADRDAKGRGRWVGAKGERQAGAKLTDEQVLAIRSDRRLLREIAADYGICFQRVSAIRNRTSWRHLP